MIKFDDVRKENIKEHNTNRCWCFKIPKTSNKKDEFKKKK